MKKEIDDRVAEILDCVEDDMSDFKKLLIVHDKIVMDSQYCVDCPTIYDGLIRGVADCQGFTKSFAYIISLLGFENEFVVSQVMNHAWNRVCVDGVYYNIDLTWDDPVPDFEGYAEHRFFMLSDEVITKDDLYHDFECSTVCNDTRYDNALFHDINSKFCYTESGCYAYCNEMEGEYARSFIKYDPETEDIPVIKKSTDYWKAGDLGYWYASFTSIDAVDDYIVLNTPESVLAYNTKTGVISELDVNISDYNTSDDFPQQCYGLTVKNGQLCVNMGLNPYDPFDFIPTDKEAEGLFGAGSTQTYVLSDNTKQKIMLGDVDQNGLVNIMDATSIQKFTSQLENFDEAQNIAADVNGDGLINIIDCTDIQKMIAGIK